MTLDIEELRKRDRFIVVVDDEELNVFNTVTVQQNRTFNSFGCEGGSSIFTGDGFFGEPDAISHWVAGWLNYEGITVPSHIRVIDPKDEEVEVI